MVLQTRSGCRGRESSRASFVEIDMLCGEARQLLLVAAAEPVGDPLLLWRAAKQLGIASAAGDDVQAQTLIALGERVTFRHPLVRSAVYRSAAVEDRRAGNAWRWRRLRNERRTRTAGPGIWPPARRDLTTGIAP